MSGVLMRWRVVPPTTGTVCRSPTRFQRGLCWEAIEAASDAPDLGAFGGAELGLEGGLGYTLEVADGDQIGRAHV